MTGRRFDDLADAWAYFRDQDRFDRKLSLIQYDHPRRWIVTSEPWTLADQRNEDARTLGLEDPVIDWDTLQAEANELHANVERLMGRIAVQRLAEQVAPLPKLCPVVGCGYDDGHHPICHGGIDCNPSVGRVVGTDVRVHHHYDTSLDFTGSTSTGGAGS